ncbi:hypothetical protein [Streptomyces boncukensis]|uniref:Toxin-antitoxin system, toxin component n=1 Tax=Streptomyces boncukensis TaxID=2711219 RepID=A0A6G4WQX1_9ACTN|nr:hypothetical protein [Streptomyces boncukensis]NGO66954.1 hypothetical protein [Streptomyces boncukensis]
MDKRAMRRSCALLVRGLVSERPDDPGAWIDPLCGRLRELSGRAVRHKLVAFPPRTVSGLWVATEDTDHILCEQNTSPWHQLLITGHEVWHILDGRRPAAGGARCLPAVDAGSLSSEALGRIMAARGPYDARAEREADLFASLLLARLTSRSWKPGYGTPSDVAVHRVDRTLRGVAGRDGP